MTLIQHNLNKLIKKIHDIALLYGRNPEKIKLIAVSKNKPISDIMEIASLKQISFGENYVQEGIEKIRSIKTCCLNLEWHFIGHLQSNKSRLIAEYFSWCQTIDSISIARKLNDKRPFYLPPLNVLIQVNISNDEKKCGTIPNNIFNIAEQIISLPKLRFRGLMAIPKLENDYNKQFHEYKKMVQLFDKLKQDFSDIDTISLGMSNDMEMAIAAGSTMLRIGRDIFGIRDNFTDT
ncbi:YggS family pyridoxal phosphate-dependent enzyme [Candidatus Pantoea edessiphila]|uniref:Pyridoxal phosphate homeostasis protein n=1 Tax=Candidatus Pantoea edessiphila TaxID=2044610 RepID=A0A2P5SXT2_9GAMM|nr:YggS family pyridoxal phosphate-dependent enzyme [Candidatus Pantoea edessiphila]MBK4775750.1 YggS family pyridoxal phosphate-dependent enzyme [Pantoea sp. Edef]PPI87146.1 YggS family pyridoxal phosphate-dependent enzyme [Candidatus Pantoea edessiphila]